MHDSASFPRRWDSYVLACTAVVTQKKGRQLIFLSMRQTFVLLGQNLLLKSIPEVFFFLTYSNTVDQILLKCAAGDVEQPAAVQLALQVCLSVVLQDPPGRFQKHFLQNNQNKSNNEIKTEIFRLA